MSHDLLVFILGMVSAVFASFFGAGVVYMIKPETKKIELWLMFGVIFLSALLVLGTLMHHIILFNDDDLFNIIKNQ
jgi:uncharacterized membrane protein YeiB